MKEGVGRALRRAIGRDDVLSRIKPREGGVSILMNEKRRDIYQYLFENPLTHLRELARETRIPVGTIDWHLGILIQEAIVSSFENRNKHHYYPTEWIETEDLACLVVLRNQISKDIFSLVKKSSGLSQTDIATELGKYQQYVQPHLSALEEYGYLTSETEGRKKIYDIGITASDLERKYEERSTMYLGSVMQMLKNDGLNPKIQGRSKATLKVKMDDGQNIFYLRIQSNPMSALLRE